jgi:CRISPR-associated endonuclease/helicase Cas3
MTNFPEEQAMAWILFFVALHDLGKFDVRFQVKLPGGGMRVYPQSFGLDAVESRGYWHGEYALYWAYHDLAERFDWKSDDFLCEAAGEEKWGLWQPWLRAIAGHHGMEPPQAREPEGHPPMVSQQIIEQDRLARLAFIGAMEALFLTPAGLSLDDDPPPCDLEFMAGFCAICDWLGSMTVNSRGEPRFTYTTEWMEPAEYLQRRQPTARQVLEESGLLARSVTTGGMKQLFPQFDQARGVQILVDALPVTAGLTLIEAPTGSGKTEAALALAAHLLAAGEAESIIFALPTQATADAMLDRIVEVAGRLFDSPDVVLAHGKSRFNPLFIDLKSAAGKKAMYGAGEREAAAQCAEWLGQSRKRVFLGQIGVCTVDQVLVSALPVRHRFVRGFGLGKSVLIIDEVHAYDAYMYGLLHRVLAHQKAMGGSAILLSATLPLPLRQALLQSWDADSAPLGAGNPYPLITRADADDTRLYELPDAERQRLIDSSRTVVLDWLETPDMLPDEVLANQIVTAAEAGANVAVICNLVADAQRLAERLEAFTEKPVVLFHSRFRFKDRQTLQQAVMDKWGKEGVRPDGAILVATQVVEQSLDIDFDWMATQLCPVDLLFQRLGRLHRHPRRRPAGFEQPACTVLLPYEHQYELHKRIYGNGKAANARVLWRTEQMVKKHPRVDFPAAYRPLIEAVYEEEAWPDEPQAITEEYEFYWQAQFASRALALQISNMENAWPDDDSHVSLLTRDGEMNLNLVPVVEGSHGRCFLDEETPLDRLEAWEKAERIMRNTLPAPRSWLGFGLPEPAEDGLVWLVMIPEKSGSWRYESPVRIFRYIVNKGLIMQEKT